MKKMKRLLAIALALVMVLALLPSTALAATPAEKNVTAVAATDKGLAKGFKSETFLRQNSYQYADSQIVHAIVTLNGDAAIKVDNAKRAATRAALAIQHANVRSAISAQKISYTVEFDYDTLLNGMAIRVAYGDLDKIAALKGVNSVHIANEYKLPDDEINMDSSNVMTGIDWLQNDFGDYGSGTVIAVLDTGLNCNHEAFQPYEGMLEDAVLTTDNMYEDCYISLKVPYAYDYADEDNDVTDTNGHGTHVAGIAAGCVVDETDGTITFAGSAPDAQLLAMKVFSDTDSTTNSGIYFAALEDAYLMDADVINMSIGSPAGFTYDSELEDEYFGNIYELLDDEGVLVCISAGNEGSQATNASNWAGAGYVTADYTDYGIIGSPSTYDGNTSVASAVNASKHALVAQVTIGGETKDIEYNDSTENGKAAQIFADVDPLQFVAIPGLGAAEDFEGIDVEGKIALISRGDLTYTEKVLNAEAAGAIGMICYDHTDEELYGMILEGTSIPAVFISKADGEALVALSEASAEGSEDVTYGPVDIAFPQTAKILDNDTAWLMSDFSSWGCTNDLRLKPTITGIGSNVWSADTNDDHGYVDMSGTSMSSPDVAGCYATLLAIGRETHPELTKQEMAKILEDLTESTAYVLTDDYDYEFSPRQQGAGLIAVDYAASSPCYIEDPIKNLYDSTDGQFSFEFVVRSLYNEAVTYMLEPTVLCDYVEEADMGTEEDPDIRLYNAMMTEYLSEYGDYTIDCPEEITVPANGEITVSVSIEMSEDLMQALDGMFPNGTFIEGYLRLINPDSYVENGDYSYYEQDYLHTTFMGFYGDWTQAPILEKADWRDVVDIDIWLNTTEVEGEGVSYAEYGYTYFDLMDQEINTDISLAYLLDEEFRGVYAGDNAFYYNEYAFNEDRIAVSNSDSESKYLSFLYMSPSTLRNARHMIMVITDAETGEIYAVDDTEYVPKSVFDEDTSYWTNNSSFLFDGTKTYGLVEPENLPNGTKVNIDYYANLAYGEDALGAMDYEDYKTDAQDYLIWSYGATVDTQAPTFEDISFEDGVLSFRVADNEYAAGVSVYDMDFEEIDSMKIEEPVAGASTGVSFEIGDEYPLVYLAAQDYATNEGVTTVAIDKTPLTLTFHVPESFEVNGAETLTGVIGDIVTLPTVTGSVPGYEFMAWVPEEVEGVNEYDGEYYFDGEELMLTGDMDLYALFSKPDGYYDPTEELALITEDRYDWSGSYAIDGYDWYADEDCDFLLSDDGTTISCLDNDIAVDYLLSFGWMYGVPETSVFDIEAVDDEGNYSIAAASTGKYLALDEDGIAFVDELSEAAVWYISFDEDWAVNIICNASNPDIWLVFDVDDQTIKATEAGIEDFDDPYNLYLFGPAEKYLYTTQTPCDHDWNKKSETCTTVTYRCTICLAVRTDLKDEPTHEYVAEDQTCTEIISKCAICGDIKTEAKATAEHNWVEVAEGTTCFTKGFECAICGATKMELKSDPTHNFVVRAETCTEIGYECTICGMPRTVMKNPDTHEWEKTDETATSIIYTCSVCSQTKEEAKQTCTHTWVKVSENYFFNNYECSLCGETKSVEKTEFDTTPAEAFDDVKDGAWYVPAINFVVSQDYFKGLSTDTFAPDTVMNRAMLVTVLYRMEGEPKVTYSKVFTDVPADKWYSNAIIWAATDGIEIVNGIGNGLFAPDQSVTREQIATILYRYAKYKKLDLTNDGDLSAFTDSCTGYAKQAMTWAVGKSIISGVKNSDGTYALKATKGGTRAEVATMLMRFCKSYPELLPLMNLPTPAAPTDPT